MGNRFINPWPQFMSGTPTPYADGFLGFYITGTDTETDTFSNTTLVTPNANPVPLDENGQPETAIFLAPSVVYKVVLYDSSMVAIKTADPVTDPAANVTVSFTIVAGNPTGSVAGNQGSIGGSGASAVWDVVNSLLYICTTTGTALTAIWTQIGATLAGAVLMTGDISPAALAASADNYNPAGNNTASIIRQDLSGDYALYGLVATGDGEVKTIHNISSANTLTLVDGTVVTSSTAANRFAFGGNTITIYPGGSVDLIYDGTSARWRQKGQQPQLPAPIPGGRLCLVTAEPVHTADKTAITTLFYTPYVHNIVPLWNGTSLYTMPFAELSQTLADATKSPLAAAVSSVYDIFLWNDAGTLRISRGPAWTDGTTRSVGTALVRKGGMYVNNALITNGPAANMGTYLGTISTSATGANGQLNMMFAPNAAAGGTGNRLDVWNMYNRRPVAAMCRDSTDSYTYTTATWRAANAAAGAGVLNRINIVCGFGEDAFRADAVHNYKQSTGDVMVITGVGVDSTTAVSGFPGISLAFSGASNPSTVYAHHSGYVGIGSHFIQWLEYSVATGTTTWYCDNGTPLIVQSGLSFKWMM